MEETLEEKINKKIKFIFEPSQYEIKNLSFLHYGHDSLVNNTSKETHFKLYIKTKHFNNINKVQRQRKVYEVLEFAFEEGLHALEMDCDSDL